MIGLASPWLLLGLGALAAPLIAHLVAREERSGTPFPSLMFIRRIPYESRRARRLGDRGLLALRCLALAALVAGFTGPRLDPTLSGEAARDDVVLALDVSYSMGGPARRDAALAAARARVGRLAAGRPVALVEFDEHARVVEGLTRDRTRLEAALGAIRPRAGGTRLASAFEAATRLLPRGGTLVVVSDLQRSAVDATAVLILGAGIDVELVPIDAAIGANAAVMPLTVVEATGGDEVVARVRNTGDAPLADGTVRLVVDGRVGDALPLALAPGAERTVRFPIALPRDRPTRLTVEVGADGIPGDDSSHAVAAPPPPVRIALVSEPASDREGPGAGRGLFLAEALALARAPSFAVERLPPRGLGGADLAGHELVIVDDAALRPAGVAAIRAHVEGGGALLVVAAEGWSAPGLEPVLPAVPGAASDSPGGRWLARSGDGSLISAAGLDRSDALAGVRVTRYRTLAPGPATLTHATLADGSPLLVEGIEGPGRVMVLATSADPRWSNLVLDPGFVPFLHAALRRLAARAAAGGSFGLGGVVDLAAEAGALPGTEAWPAYLAAGGAAVVQPPGGATRRLPPGRSLYVTAQPGHHRALRADGIPPALPFAVNTDRLESQLDAYAPPAVLARVRRLAAGPGADPADPRIEPEGTALGWWLIAFGGLLLLAEAALARAIRARRGRDHEPASEEGGALLAAAGEEGVAAPTARPAGRLAAAGGGR